MSDSPFADLRGLPYYDEPTLHLNLGGRLWAWEFDGWKPESMSWKTGCYIHTGLSNTQHDLPRARREGVLLLDRGQQLRELPDREHEALDLLQRGGAHHGPRDPPAQRRARVPLLRGLPVAALQARSRRTSSTSRSTRRPRTSPRSPARRRWRRSSARPARACGTSASCASATRRSTAGRSRSAGSACPATSPTSCAARSRTAPRSTTRSSGRARTSGSSASAGGPTSSTTSRAASRR